MTLPKIHLKKSHQERVLAGSPWIFSNEIENFSAVKNLAKGELVQVNLQDNKPFAIGYFNAASLISVRILTYDLAQKIDESFFVDKISAAKILREKLYDSPYYRLIHSEGDFLPGLVIDRFGDVLVCQISTAGMENLRKVLVASLRKIFPNSKIIFKNNSESRRLENLEVSDEIEGDEIAEKFVDSISNPLSNLDQDQTSTSHGEPERSNLGNKKILVKEGEIEFLFDVKNGQKTGWFFDQKPNRQLALELISKLALQKNSSQEISVIDAFCYVGGFGVNALAAGADKVYFIDSSPLAISLAKENCEKLLSSQHFKALNLKNSLPKLEFLEGKVFDELEKMIAKNQQFDFVLLDPPAFIKSKKDLFAGLRGYEKLVKLASNLVKPQGFVMLSSCSHHAKLSDLIAASSKAFFKIQRQAKLIKTSGAGFDHPIHPSLPEGEYLKSLIFQVF